MDKMETRLRPGASRWLSSVCISASDRALAEAQLPSHLLISPQPQPAWRPGATWTGLTCAELEPGDVDPAGEFSDSDVDVLGCRSRTRPVTKAATASCSSRSRERPDRGPVRRDAAAQTQGPAWRVAAVQTQGPARRDAAAQMQGPARRDAAVQMQGPARQDAAVQTQGPGCCAAVLSQVQALQRELVQARRSLRDALQNRPAMATTAMQTDNAVSDRTSAPSLVDEPDEHMAETGPSAPGQSSSTTLPCFTLCDSDDEAASPSCEDAASNAANSPPNSPLQETLDGSSKSPSFEYVSCGPEVYDVDSDDSSDDVIPLEPQTNTVCGTGPTKDSAQEFCHQKVQAVAYELRGQNPQIRGAASFGTTDLQNEGRQPLPMAPAVCSALAAELQPQQPQPLQLSATSRLAVLALPTAGSQLPLLEILPRPLNAKAARQEPPLTHLPDSGALQGRQTTLGLPSAQDQQQPLPSQILRVKVPQHSEPFRQPQKADAIMPYPLLRLPGAESRQHPSGLVRLPKFDARQQVQPPSGPPRVDVPQQPQALSKPPSADVPQQPQKFLHLHGAESQRHPQAPSQPPKTGEPHQRQSYLCLSAGAPQQPQLLPQPPRAELLQQMQPLPQPPTSQAQQRQFHPFLTGALCSQQPQILLHLSSAEANLQLQTQTQPLRSEASELPQSLLCLPNSAAPQQLQAAPHSVLMNSVHQPTKELQVYEGPSRRRRRPRKSAPSEQSRHKCSQCDQYFSQPSDLRSHMLTHEGPHRCSMCSQTFTRPEQRYIHTVRVHSDQRIETLSRSAQLQTRKNTTPRMLQSEPQRCAECTRLFFFPDLFQAHMATHREDSLQANKSAPDLQERSRSLCPETSPGANTSSTQGACTRQ